MHHIHNIGLELLRSAEVLQESNQAASVSMSNPCFMKVAAFQWSTSIGSRATLHMPIL